MRLAVRISAALLFLPAGALAAEHKSRHVNPWMIAPFLFLVLAIAVAPFIHRHW